MNEPKPTESKQKNIEDYPVALKVTHIQEILACGLRQAYELVEQQERAKTPGFPVVRIGRAIRVPRDAFFSWFNGGHLNQFQAS